MNGSIRRIEPTLLVLAVVVAGAFIGIALGQATAPHEWAIGYGIASAFHDGMNALLTASWTWVLLSALVPSLGRWREGPPSRRATFDRVIFPLGLILAAAFTTLRTLLTNPRLTLEIHGGPVPVGECVLWAVVATAMLFGIAVWITRGGIGNGVALTTFVCGYLTPFLTSARDDVQRLQHGPVGLFRAPLAIAFFIGLALFCRWFSNVRDDLPLARTGEHGTAPVAMPLALPLRWNLVGMAPVFFAYAVIGAVDAAFAYLGSSSPLRHLAPYWVALGVLVVAATYLLTAVSFDTAWVGTLLERHGLDLVGRPDGATIESHLDRLIERRIALSAAVLLALVAIPLAFGRAIGFRLTVASWTGTAFLLGYAVTADTVRNVRAHRAIEAAEAAELEQAEAQAGEDASADVEVERWVEIASYDVELEATLVRARIEHEGIGAVIVANRVIPILGTFAPWEWTVPAYPGLAIHRRLGGGRVSLRVPAAAAARAAAILDTIPAEPALVSAPA